MADGERDELVQLAERALLAAEQAYRADPSPANQRRVAQAYVEVRAARGESAEDPGLPFPLGGRRPADLGSDRASPGSGGGAR